ncbi:hypothetical protein FMEAI12_5490009 [Parafrankia sp. Ea1.12]|nr:hypothetical protein FMEAI12_5490009 [Parafrankia sp. Ea1.12]
MWRVSKSMDLLTRHTSYRSREDGGRTVVGARQPAWPRPGDLPRPPAAGGSPARHRPMGRGHPPLAECGGPRPGQRAGDTSAALSAAEPSAGEPSVRGRPADGSADGSVVRDGVLGIRAWDLAEDEGEVHVTVVADEGGGGRDQDHGAGQVGRRRAGGEDQLVLHQ